MEPSQSVTVDGTGSCLAERRVHGLLEGQAIRCGMTRFRHHGHWAAAAAIDPSHVCLFCQVCACSIGCGPPGEAKGDL